MSIINEKCDTYEMFTNIYSVWRISCMIITYFIFILQNSYTQKSIIFFINSEMSEKFITLRLYFSESGYGFHIFYLSLYYMYYKKRKDLLLFPMSLSLNLEMENRSDIWGIPNYLLTTQVLHLKSYTERIHLPLRV